MKRKLFRGTVQLFGLAMIVSALWGCKDDKKEDTSTAPLVMTNAASWIGRNWVVLRCQVNAKGQMSVVTFQYDTSKTYTQVASPVPDTTSRSSLISFTCTVTGLRANTTYHYRANAISQGGTSNGSDVAFTTSDSTGITINFNPEITYDSIYDYEGNVYRTVQIGSQTWTAENLRSTRLNDGTDIAFTPESAAWGKLDVPGYCWYNSDSVGYGALYNWYAVGTGKLCPAGWHVPSDEEWTTITDYLGGQEDAGGKMKEAGTSHWLKPNTGATNESGFTAIPTGYRSYAGGFNSIGSYSFWWTSTEWSSTGAWYRDLYYSYTTIDRSNSHKNSGANVRCVKD